MSKELKIGIVAVIIIVAFVWGFNFLKGQDILGPGSRNFKVEYKNVGGLTKASLVTINGLKVGMVNKINFNEDPTKKGQLVVSFTVENDFEFSKNSIVKIYSPSPISGSNLAVIPSYEGEVAVDGDYLKGLVEPGLFTSIGEKLDPLQAKVEMVLVTADSLFKNINNILDVKTQNSLKASIKTLEYTLSDVRKTVKSVNSVLDSSSVNLSATIKNTKNITENLSKISDTLVNANIGDIVRKAEITLASVNSILEGIEKGKGSLGKLVTDDAMYNNLTNVSKELEELLREMKLNPKRFVHFSLFGKRAKPYQEENKKEK
ncbi:MlaD family protein [Polaribacter sp. MSW13]|uniref:MlaD family protein n=1 Tax=Polaribacter marinus TaxID=2916838 RepID=A0A9X2AHN3_9FLAO|nr:MlaD family protein [Polaribacter marinus]MCI2227726.1 MlaD family protein [Polaribacter marinus]